MPSPLRRLVVFAILAVASSRGAAAQGNTFRYASSGDVLTMDPHSANEALTNGMKQNIYEGLVHRRWDGVIEPALAVSWSRPDATTWRFNLRRGVTFHDGSPFTADDVVFSFRRNKNKSSQLSAYLAAVKEVRKIDAFTVEYVTSGPYPILLSDLVFHFIMSKRWCEEHKTIEPVATADKETYATRHANGTGPFILEERVADTRTVLVANPRWWGDAKKEHNLSRAEFRPIANAATRVAALLSGDLDMMYPVPLQDLPRLRATPGFHVLQGPEMRVIFLGFDQFRDELLDLPGTGKNPFKDVRVRRAFYQAIDVQAIHQKIMRGASVPTGSMVAKEVAGYDPKIAERYPYDPAAARKLLAEAGWAKGLRVTLDCPNDRYVNDEAICQAVVAMLGHVGVEVTLNSMPKSKWNDKIYRKDTSFYLLGWSPVTFDAHNALLNLMTLDGSNAGIYNDGRYRNPKVEELTAAAAVELDEVRRKQLLVEAQRIHKEDFGHIPLHQQMLAWAVRDGVEMKLDPLDYVRLRNVRMKGKGAPAASAAAR